MGALGASEVWGFSAASRPNVAARELKLWQQVERAMGYLAVKRVAK